MKEQENQCGELYCEGRKLGYCPVARMVDGERTSELNIWNHENWEAYAFRTKNMVDDECKFPEELNNSLTTEPKFTPEK